MDSIQISKVFIGQRFRKEIGDVSGLQLSMANEGLLQPIVITSKNRLVIGERRLEAAKRLGWKEIPCKVIDVPSLLRAERDENKCRKDFLTSEMVSIGKAIEEEEAEKAKVRQGGGVVQIGPEVGRSSEKAAEAVGMSRHTYEAAKEVVESGTPELVAAVDAGTVSVSDAAKIVDEPKKVQNEAVKAVESGAASTVAGALKLCRPCRTGVPKKGCKACAKLNESAASESAPSKPRTTKAKPSNEPLPDDGLCPKCGRPWPEPEATPSPSPPNFERFWEVFPRMRRQGKEAAKTAWKKAIKKKSAAEIIAAAEEYAQSPVGKGQYVKGPVPWLNQGCWDDDREAWQREDSDGRPKQKDRTSARFDPKLADKYYGPDNEGTQENDARATG